MVKTAIVAEYDPFHTGHHYHLKTAREITGADVVFIIMSGSFTQRCCPSAFPKHLRAGAALSCGADAVFELPFDFSSASAETYATSAVNMADKLGADYLCFGSECGDIDLLSKTADLLISPSFNEKIKEILKSFPPLSFPSVRERSVRELAGDECADLLSFPNNILGIEYIKALKMLKSTIVPKTVKRIGAQHNTFTPSGKYTSASNLRRLIMEGDNNFQNFIPEPALPYFSNYIPANIQFLDRAFVYKARNMSREELENITGVSEGLHNRIRKAASSCRNIADFMEQVKSKRYTMSRIRRIVLYILMDVTSGSLKDSAGYARVLGFHESARPLLKSIKDSGLIQIISKYSDIDMLNDADKELYLREIKAADLRSQCFDIPGRDGDDMREKIVVLK